MSQSQRRVALSSIASNTGARSPGEELMTPNTSAVAVCCSECLARLGDQPRVLHRDYRLRGEVLQQRDLFVGERPHLLPVDAIMPSSLSSCRRGTHSNVPADRRVSSALRAKGNSCCDRSSDMGEGLRPRSTAASPDWRTPDTACRRMFGEAVRQSVRRGRAEILAVIKLQSCPARRRIGCAPSPALRRTPARGRRARN